MDAAYIFARYRTNVIQRLLNVQQLEDDLAKARQEAKQVYKEFKDLEARFEAVETKRAELQSKVSDLERQKNLLQQETSASITTAESQVSELTRQNRLIEAKFIETRRELKSLELVKLGMAEKINELTREVEGAFVAGQDDGWNAGVLEGFSRCVMVF